jgi:hypothetical protein
VAGVAAVGTFGAFLALTSLNVVGVTAHSGSATPSGAAVNLEILPPGDFFGPTGNAGSGAGQRAGFPVLAAGGDLPLLTSGGS